MRPTVRYRLTALALGLGAALAAAGAMQSAKADIVVGLAVPGNGRHAERGEVLREAAERAIGTLNAAGGVLGHKLLLAIEADQCSDAGAAGAARALLSRDVKLVLGHPCEKSALAGARVYGPAGALFLATATRHPSLTEPRAGAGVFRISGREDRQGEAAGAWLASEAENGAIAIVQDRTAYARAITTGIAGTLKERGLAAPSIHPIVASEKSYTKVIAALAAEAPRAIFFAGYPNEAIIILKGLRSAGVPATFLGSDALATAEFAEAAATSGGSVHVMLRPEQHRAGLANAPVLPVAAAASRRRHAQEPGPLLEAAIDIWARAAVRAGTVDPAAVAPLLQAGGYDIPGLGLVSFDANGDARIPSFLVGSWNGKRWAPES